MRRSFIKRYPDRECPIKGSLSEYSEADRGSLMNAVSDAIKSANPAADEAFAKWAEKRSS